MSLVLEIEFLMGTCFASVGPDAGIADWPPQPDRIFSALVATWGARGESTAEAAALEWLEAQAVPGIQASEHFPRTAPVSFVPPNDFHSGRSGNKNLMPGVRPRQARQFPAARPDSPILRLFWVDAAPDQETFEALSTLAADTAYVGHSASLTRCQFIRKNDVESSAQTPKRRVYPGRFSELKRGYGLFVTSNGKRGRPLAGPAVRARVESPVALPQAFSDRWLLLEHVTGEMPDIRASAHVARAMRDALLSGYKSIGLENRIPEVISGHAPDGSPSRAPHVAIIPLSFAGFRHADGHVMGFAVVPPCGEKILGDDDFRKVLRRIAPMNEELGRRVLEVKSRIGAPSERAFALGFSPSFEATVGKVSMDPSRYTKPSRLFGTVTPIVLDRHLKQTGSAQVSEIAEQIIAGCRNIGLPEPFSVIPNKHSPVLGAQSAAPSGKAPHWLNWRLPPSLSSRQLTHAVIQFDGPIQGPLLLCAGRFVGLGLCLPLSEENNKQ